MYGTRPHHAAELRRILRLPVGADPWLMQLRDHAARQAIADLSACGPGGALEAHAIVAGWLMEQRRARVLLHGHVGDSRRAVQAWEAGR